MAALIWRCLLGLAPTYLVEICGPTLSARSSRSLLKMNKNFSMQWRIHRGGDWAIASPHGVEIIFS